jgi:hypothetical protein
MTVSRMISVNIYLDITDAIASMSPLITVNPEIYAISRRPNFQASAESAGWSSAVDSEGDPCYHWVSEILNEEALFHCDNWERLCHANKIELKFDFACGYMTVSTWLAEQLILQGESVAIAMFGTYVWARFAKIKGGVLMPLAPAEDDPVLAKIAKLVDLKFIPGYEDPMGKAAQTKIIGYQVQNYNGEHWGGRDSYVILDELTAKQDLLSARIARSSTAYMMIAILDGDIDGPQFYP